MDMHETGPSIEREQKKIQVTPCAGCGQKRISNGRCRGCGLYQWEKSRLTEGEKEKPQKKD